MREIIYERAKYFIKMKNIQKLSQNSSRLLCSTNIITSVFSAVKELVENAIDGSATNIEVKLENYGLERIEVRDNGCGIERDDISCVAKAHCTSKLTSHLELGQLETYGFRGEALSALSSTSSLSITTKTINDDISTTYSFDKSGDVTASKPSSSPCGTIVIGENLFRDLPVRKKYYRSEKNKKEELKKIEDLLCAYSCAQIGTRFALYHNKILVWQKSLASDMKAVLIQVFGSSVFGNLEFKTFESAEEEIKIDAFLPKTNVPFSTVTRTQSDRSILLINKRPVTIKAITKLIQETYLQSVGQDDTKSRFPIYLLLITVPTSKLDINVDPNKTQVLLHNFETFMNVLSEFLQSCFSKHGTRDTVASLEHPNNSSKPQCPVPSLPHIQRHREPNGEKGHNEDLLHRPPKSGLFNNKVLHQLSLNESVSINCSSNNGNFSSVKPRIGGLFTHSENLDSLYNGNSKQQTTFRANEETGFLECQAINKVKEKKRDAEKHPRSCSSSESLEPVPKRANMLQKPLDKDYILNKIERLPMSESHCLEPKSISEQSQQGSVRLRKNIDMILNNCHQTLLDTKSDGMTPTPNFPQLKDLFTQAAATKTSEVRQQTFAVNKPDDVVALRQSIRNGICSTDPPRSATVFYGNAEPGNQLSSNDWSLGKAANNAGKEMQPVSILVPSPVKRSHVDPAKSPRESKKKKLLSVEKPTEAELPKSPLSGFEYFCRSNRLEMQADCPEYSNQEIAQALYQQWKTLPQEKKLIYKELATKQYQKTVKPKKQLSNTLSQALSKSKKTESPNSKNRYKKKKEVKWDFVLEDLKALNSLSEENMNEDVESEKLIYTPIKTLSSGVWLCLQNENLVLLNSSRVKETLIYHRLLDTFQLKADALGIPIALNSELIMNPECWQTLMTMFSEDANVLNHTSLTSNGFSVRAIKGNEELVFELAGIATCVPSYGVHDLEEVLRIIQRKGLSLSLKDYRPSKMTHYLQSEAVRINRQSLTVQRQDELIDLLKQKQKYLPDSTTQCFHDKPFQQCVFDISGLN